MHPINELSDEELLLASRMGDYKAESILAQRMFVERFRYCRFAATDASRILDEWSLNEAYLKAFLSAVSGYRFGRFRFVTYFSRSLKNEIVHLASKKIREQAENGRFVSLDEPPSTEAECFETALADFIPSGDFTDDPRAFLNYAERLEELNRLPAGADPMMLDVVRLSWADYSVRDTAKICGIQPNRVKYLLGRYRRWVERTKRLIGRHAGTKKKPPEGLDDKGGVD